MTHLYDEDGIDGPWEKAIAKPFWWELGFLTADLRDDLLAFALGFALGYLLGP